MAKKSKLAVTGLSVTGNLLNHTPGRRAAILRLSRYGFQANHTPYELAAQMLPPAADLAGKSILVIFNLEFLEVLSTEGQDMSLVTFIADTAAERRFARLVYGVNTKLAGKHSWERALGHKKQNELIRRLIMGKHSMGAAADITFSNPPYNGGIDLKIILAMNEAKLLKRLICVHPATWLVDPLAYHKPAFLEKDSKVFRDSILPFVTSLTVFNGNSVFQIRLGAPCVITDAQLGGSSNNGGVIPKVSFSLQGNSYPDIPSSDITLHGEGWLTSVKDFYTRIAVANKGKPLLVDSYQNPKGHPFEAKVAIRTGTAGRVKGAERPIAERDLLTIVTMKPQDCALPRKGSPDQYHSFWFATEVERTNFLNYLATDFARLCLSLVKKNQRQLLSNVADMIPSYLDFTQIWDDDKLFKYFGYHTVADAIRVYSREYLPIYHPIYPNNKKTY